MRKKGDRHSLPIVLRMAGRPVILVGDGPVADAQRRMLVRAGARIVEEGSKAQLAIVVDDVAAVSRLKVRGTLVYAVDRPELCDFTLATTADPEPAPEAAEPPAIAEPPTIAEPAPVTARAAVAAAPSPRPAAALTPPTSEPQATSEAAEPPTIAEPAPVAARAAVAAAPSPRPAAASIPPASDPEPAPEAAEPPAIAEPAPVAAHVAVAAAPSPRPAAASVPPAPEPEPASIAGDPPLLAGPGPSPVIADVPAIAASDPAPAAAQAVATAHAELELVPARTPNTAAGLAGSMRQGVDELLRSTLGRPAATLVRVTTAVRSRLPGPRQAPVALDAALAKGGPLETVAPETQPGVEGAADAAPAAAKPPSAGWRLPD